jgi:hypothetical protein
MTPFNYPSRIPCTKTPNLTLTYSILNIFSNLFKKILTTDNDKFDDDVQSYLRIKTPRRCLYLEKGSLSS